MDSSGSSGEKPRLDAQICEWLVPGRFRDPAECVGRWERRLDLSQETRSLGIRYRETRKEGGNPKVQAVGDVKRRAL